MKEGNLLFRAVSLSGAWRVDYRPAGDLPKTEPASPEFLLREAVPGYWEERGDEFRFAPFFAGLQLNPEYGMQRYPMAGRPPDMALPTVRGAFTYQRTVELREIGGQAEFFCGGVQNAAEVFINGRAVGRQEGYGVPFSFPIPEGVLTAGENRVTMVVSNLPLKGYAGGLVSGLTNRAANEGTGGVTGEVEIRFYAGELRDVCVISSPDADGITIRPVFTGGGSLPYRYEICAGRGGPQRSEVPLASGEATGEISVPLPGAERWSPENPVLHTLVIRSSGQELRRSFGLRRLTAAQNPEGDGRIFLNGEPIFLRGVTEHCYFPVTVHPTDDPAYYRRNVRLYKSLGFNFIRFHTWVPDEAYLDAADTLGILVQIECPNNAPASFWKQIVTTCRRHPSVVIFCAGNELMLDDDRVAFLEGLAAVVHQESDACFSPMSAMRGVEYMCTPENSGTDMVEKPFWHNPARMKKLAGFCNLFNSYNLGLLSYTSLNGTPEKLDENRKAYGGVPCLSHEICISGTYCDLSLLPRYRGTRIGETAFLSSVEEHLAAQGLLARAPLFYRNSCEWQRRIRKHCFETARATRALSGYDFLGDIDTHWHTFGYHVGMMNEFYEMKPGETPENVRRYNGETVLLAGLGTRFSFTAGEEIPYRVSVSHYGKPLSDATLTVRLFEGERTVFSRTLRTGALPAGEITDLPTPPLCLPATQTPCAYRLSITLEGGALFAENEWEIYAFPAVSEPCKNENLLVATEIGPEELTAALRAGSDVLLLGSAPFTAQKTSFQIALAGRTDGNLATVIADHPALEGLPHAGFCGWQFRYLLEGGSATVFPAGVPFDPIVEVAANYKYAYRQAALYEYRVGAGRLLVCTLSFREWDPAAAWLRNRLIEYAQSPDFAPRCTLTEADMERMRQPLMQAASNANMAFNANDKTMRA